MPPTNDQASLALALQIDQMCDRFEARWKAGERPRAEDFVTRQPEHLRGRLLLALLPLELELLARDGRSPTEADCRRRFPGLESVVRQVFASHQEKPASRDRVRSPQVPAPRAEPVPKTIGRFQVNQVLGEGAFGTVYLAHDPRLDRDVAIKVPKHDSLGDSFDTNRFLREAKTAASLRHANICPVYEAGVEDGRPYIVMAHVAGQPLDKLLKASKTLMPAKQAALVIRRLALALQAAHDKGIVHRDLKPANVMIDRDRKDVVVMDFGLARGPRLKDAGTTQSGVIMGTPAYMSPEQARGEAKTLGPAADVYSLGVMMYEMLAGKRPFNGTVTEVLGQILHVEPEPPSKVRKGIDPQLEAICLKAMAKETSARYASMKEFAAALDVWLRRPSGSAGAAAKSADTKEDAEASAGTSAREVAEVFAAMLAQQKQETAAAVGDAVRKARTPRWVFVLLALLFVGGISALGAMVYFTRTPTVEVLLTLDLDLNDPSLTFFLDDKPVSADALARPIELTVGEHVLVVKRGAEEVRRVTFRVGTDLGGRIEVLADTKEAEPLEPPWPLSPRVPAPIAHFSFDDGPPFRDVRGRAGAAKAVGPLDIAPGVAGKAAMFPGSNGSYLRVENYPAIHAYERFTVATWMKGDLEGSGGGRIAGRWFGRNSFRLWLKHDEVSIQFCFDDGGAEAVVVARARCLPDTWTHVAGTFDGRHVRLYLNGHLADEKAVADDPNVRQLASVLGGGPVPTKFQSTDSAMLIGPGIKGLLDELMLFDNALDAAQVRSVLELAPSRPLTPLPGEWTPLLTRAEDLDRWLISTGELGQTIRFTDGVLHLSRSSGVRPPFRARDYVIRGRVKFLSGNNLSVFARNGQSGYEAFYRGDGSLQLKRNDLVKYTFLGQGPVQADADGFLDLALAVHGSRVALFAARKLVTEANNEAITDGGILLRSISKGEALGGAQFKQFEVCVLDWTKLTPEEVLALPPSAP